MTLKVHGREVHPDPRRWIIERPHPLLGTVYLAWSRPYRPTWAIDRETAWSFGHRGSAEVFVKGMREMADVTDAMIREDKVP
jgi:hypothetical protein